MSLWAGNMWKKKRKAKSTEQKEAYQYNYNKVLTIEEKRTMYI